MTIYMYLDESGSIHKNSKSKYFAVGGYLVLPMDKNKVIASYRKINKKIKEEHNYDLAKEIKAYEMNDQEKIMFFERIQNIPSFYGFSKVFLKSSMQKEIVNNNIFFNYAVKLLFLDCILPLIKNEKIDFIISIDNRNISVGNLKTLEDYLNTEFCLSNYTFKVKYYDSKTNYGIQLADLIVNTFYNYFKDYNFIKKVIKVINFRKFRVSIFPGKKIKGRISKITFDK